MIVADKDVLLILTGNGDVLEPEGRHRCDRIGRKLCAGSAAKALDPITRMIPKRSPAAQWQVAAEVCVFTNDRVTVEEI